MRKLVFGSALFLLFYTFFWLNFFHVFPLQKSQAPLLNHSVLSASSSAVVISEGAKLDHPPGDLESPAIPQGYFIPLQPRKQVFNLSCEFAAAASILFYYTNNQSFSPQNELSAEKILIVKIPASQNPNIGIRMGDTATTSAEVLYTNLNQRFGGSDYYGLHAPPFIDLFPQYGLLARPIDRNNVIYSIRKAIYSGHLVMAWIRIGYGEAVDIALSYGKTKVVRGEHTVVIHGFDDWGVTVMDPASAISKKLSYDTILNASRLFPMPFLEVFPSNTSFSYEPQALIDPLTNLDRSVIKVLVENGSGEVGNGQILSGILQDFGYKVVSVQNANNSDYDGVAIQIKKDITDYKKLLIRDLKLASYTIATLSADFPNGEPVDAVIVIGK